MDLNIRDFPDDLHRKMRMCIARDEITIRDCIVKLVEEYVAEVADETLERVVRR